MKPVIRRPVRTFAAVGLVLLACSAHAPPATGRDKGPFAPIDPEYPEVNCELYHTIDCRPATGW